MEMYTERDLQDMFDDILNDSEETVVCCGLEFDPADILKTMDPIAYRCAFGDWLDAGIADEHIFLHSDGEYYNEPEEV